jgi:hypothetical protein
LGSNPADASRRTRRIASNAQTHACRRDHEQITQPIPCAPLERDDFSVNRFGIPKSSGL